MLKIEKKDFLIFEKLVKLYCRAVLLVGHIDNVQFVNIESCLRLPLKRWFEKLARSFERIDIY